jgi:SOS response regulatory protein OraA/RecX
MIRYTLIQKGIDENIIEEELNKIKSVFENCGL